jgi:hypothetical protein
VDGVIHYLNVSFKIPSNGNIVVCTLGRLHKDVLFHMPQLLPILVLDIGHYHVDIGQVAGGLICSRVKKFVNFLSIH